MIKHLAGKEKRLMKDVNYFISKAVVKFVVENGVSVIGLEDLIRIRARTKNNLRKNKNISIIAGFFINCNNSLSIKAKSSGIIIEYVNPEYTFKAC